MSFLNGLMAKYKRAGSNFKATLMKDAEDTVSGGGGKRERGRI